MTKRMEKEHISGKTVRNMSVILKTIIDMATEKCFGKMEKCIKDNGLTEYRRIL